MVEVKVASSGMSVTPAGNSSYIKIHFSKDDQFITEKTYYLLAGQTLEDYLPKIKDDADDIEKNYDESKKFEPLKDKVLDLSEVRSARELSKDKFEQKARAEQARREEIDAKAKAEEAKLAEENRIKKDKLGEKEEDKKENLTES